MNQKCLVFLCLYFSYSPFGYAAGNPVQNFFNKAVPKMQGCGPGAAVFSQDTWLSTTAATAVNSTFSPVLPFTTTSGVSGCQGGPKNLVDNSPAFNFLIENYEDILFEISKGSGESLTAFLELLQTPASKKELITKNLKDHFATIINDANNVKGLYSKIIMSTKIKADNS